MRKDRIVYAILILKRLYPVAQENAHAKAEAITDSIFLSDNPRTVGV